MAEFELSDESSVGILVRTRVRQFEERHPGSVVYAGDSRGMWEIRFGYGKGKEQSRTAYISAPTATGWMIRIHWPAGGLGDIERLDLSNTAGMEGFILKALEMEERDF
jgi:hypothetical protein